METRFIGKSVQRKEGPEKVTGSAQYLDDLAFPGMLHGATVRSPIPRGRIRAINFRPHIPWNEFTIVRAADIPCKNCVALIIDDQPCLAAEVVNHAEEHVLLLPHPNTYLLQEPPPSLQTTIHP